MSADQPTLRILSLGAGVQSTALLLLAAQGKLPKPDAAIFADTGWEPRAVYDHLQRIITEVAEPAGIPVYKVTRGNIREDALNPDAPWFGTIPLYIRNPDGSEGMLRRQCTAGYKIAPIRAKVRELLGARTREDGRVLSPKKGRWAEQWIGISTDERDRALDKDGNLKTGDVAYSRNRYPLLELGMDRAQCHALLDAAGLDNTPKSACIGCPFHTNAHWRMIRENPADWADAVDFDKRIRKGSARATVNGSELNGKAYLHRARVPLARAPIDHVTYGEWAGRQGDALQLLQLAAFEDSLTAEDRDSLTGCSPFSNCSPEEEEPNEQ
jgi:hypothetical protein